MYSYHMSAYEQFKRNWRDSFMTMSYINTKNSMWKLKWILDVRIVRDVILYICSSVG